MTGSPATLVLHSPAFAGHDTGQHPERPARIRAITTELEQRGLLRDRPELAFAPATFDIVGRVHDPRYLALLTRIVASGGGWIDADTLCAVDSLDVALLAAGAATTAVSVVLAGSVKRAFALVRPPGHHATRDRAMGFCLINTAAVAAQAAIDQGLERVAIIDWDVHHGNGTEAIFASRADVLYCSVHQYGNGFFPGTGAASDTGIGAGAGFTLNVPLHAGADDKTYRQVFTDVFAPKIAAFRPDLFIISAGFDAHHADPLGAMAVTEDGFRDMATHVLDWANAHADGRVVAVLEGGYDLTALGRSVAAVLETFDAAS
jgi:acetoin utilization deacetylase AcuC-like enzyme